MASLSTVILKRPGSSTLPGFVGVRVPGCGEFHGTSLGCKLHTAGVIRAVSTQPSEQATKRVEQTKKRVEQTTKQVDQTTKQVEQTTERMKEAMKQRTIISPTLASRWRDVHGATDWKGMLDPELDADVRAELIRYGEFMQATYDGFDGDEYSKYHGSCRYCKDNFLLKVGLVDTGYEVTKYLYSTTDVPSLLLLKNDLEEAWSRDSNWAGYVAVCTDENRVKQLGRRDIVVAWRGTRLQIEWAANLKRNLVPNSMDDRDKSDGFFNPKLGVEQGFLSLYITKNSKTRYNKSSAREQLLRELSRLIKKYDNETLSITITGHSLGAALALLSAYDIAESGINRHFIQNANIPTAWNQKTTPTPTSDPGKTSAVKAIPITVFSFAGPRVGNTAFVDRVTALGVKVLRVVNVNDLVPKVPGLLFNGEIKIFNDALEKLPWTYSHTDLKLELNNDHSPFLRPHANLLQCHNSEGYLHMVAGYVGKNKDFKLQLKRDIALVNKYSDFLKPHKYIPDNWWQLENKGLVLNEDYEWVQAERNTEDIPAPEATETNSPK